MVVNDEDEFNKVLSVTWLPPDGEWSAEQLKQCVFLFSDQRALASVYRR